MNVVHIAKHAAHVLASMEWNVDAIQSAIQHITTVAACDTKRVYQVLRLCLMGQKAWCLHTVLINACRLVLKLCQCCICWDGAQCSPDYLRVFKSACSSTTARHAHLHVLPPSQRTP